MATHKQALKRHRQSLRACSRNRGVKTHIKNAVKAVNSAIENKDKDQASKELRRANSILDKAASKRVIHWRKAKRKMSRLQKAINKMDQTISS